MRWHILALPLLVLGTLALAACAPGGSHTGANPTTKPTSLQIKDYEVTQPTPTTLLVEDAALVQKIYNSAVALPSVPAMQACPAIGGPRYDLTFLEGTQTVATATADSGGCGSVTLGANDVRQANQAFWQLMTQAITEATPPLQPDQAEVVHFSGPQTPPLLSTVAAAAQAQQLYAALHALPRPPANASCQETTGERYTLVFFAAQQMYDAQLDPNGCISGPAEYEQHQANAAFWQLLHQTIASAPTQAARPDTLDLKTVPASNDPSASASAQNITNQNLIQKLYDAIYALPQQPAGQTCSTNPGTISGLTFFKDGVELLSVIADAGCGTVTADGGFARLADQAFWNLLHQAQTS